MKKLYSILFLNLIAAFVYADTEPANNYFSGFDPLALNGNANGVVIYGSDMYDYYQVVTNADGNLTISITGSTSDYIYLSLYDSDTTIAALGYSNNIGTSGTSFTVEGLAAGTYYVQVGQLTSGTNSYTLSNTLDPEVTVNDAEPNNTAATFLPLTVNSTVTGHIGFRSNGGSIDTDDYYQVVTPVDGNLTFSLQGTQAAFVTIALLDVDGTTQLGADVALGTNGVNLTVNGLAAGTYYMRVSSYNTPYYCGYTLTDSLIEELPLNDIEPNDTVSTALTLNVNSTVTGHIGFRSNGGAIDTDDYYQVVTPADGNLKFSLQGTQVTYVTLALLDLDGTTQLGADVALGTNGVNLTVNGLAAGTYYLRVSSYNLPFYCGYTLTDSLIEELPLIDIEPNDTITTAIVFNANSTVSGHIGYRYNGGAMDVHDVWQLVTASAGDISINTVFTQGAYIYINLLNSSGGVVTGNSGTGSVSFTATAQPAGTYYVRLSSFNTPYYNGYSMTNTAAVGIAEKSSTEKFTISPNPANDFCTLHFDAAIIQQPAVISVIDFSGKAVFTKTISPIGNETYLLPTALFRNGIYLVEVREGNQVFRQKLAVNR